MDTAYTYSCVTFKYAYSSELFRTWYDPDTYRFVYSGEQFISVHSALLSLKALLSIFLCNIKVKKFIRTFRFHMFPKYNYGWWKPNLKSKKACCFFQLSPTVFKLLLLYPNPHLNPPQALSYGEKSLRNFMVQTHLLTMHQGSALWSLFSKHFLY